MNKLPQELKISVTQMYIDEGLPDCGNCPVALAAIASLIASGVDVRDYLPSVGKQFVSVFYRSDSLDKQSVAHTYLQNEQTEEFITRFDLRKKVKPFETVLQTISLEEARQKFRYPKVTKNK